MTLTDRVPIVGQPFTLTKIGVPINAELTCHCGGAETTVVIALSTPAACPSCRKVYSLVFNPTTGKIEMNIGIPSAVGAQVPS